MESLWAFLRGLPQLSPTRRCHTQMPDCEDRVRAGPSLPWMGVEVPCAPFLRVS